jgi:hypothetical protein
MFVCWKASIFLSQIAARFSVRVAQSARPGHEVLTVL